MRKFLDALSAAMPYIVIVYSIYGMIVWRHGTHWGLPRVFWHSMCLVTAVLVILINWLAKKDS